jgi:hypothetical protein
MQGPFQISLFKLLTSTFRASGKAKTKACGDEALYYNYGEIITESVYNMSKETS